MAPSARVRANLEVPAIMFDIAAQIAQIPSSVPSRTKQTVIEAIKKTDLRRSPSMLACFDRIRIAALTGRQPWKTVSAVDVLHGLAHCRWQVAPTGAYAFFYSRIRSLKITDVADYDFNWGNVRGQTILDARGEEMRINTKSPPPARKVAPHLRKRFKDTREGQRLLGEKVFASSGTDANGNYPWTYTGRTTTHSSALSVTWIRSWTNRRASWVLVMQSRLRPQTTQHKRPCHRGRRHLRRRGRADGSVTKIQRDLEKREKIALLRSLVLRTAWKQPPSSKLAGGPAGMR